MEIKRTVRFTVDLSIEDLITLLKKEFNLADGIVSVRPWTETETILGADIHDADYIEIFKGIKITYEEDLNK